MCNYVYHGKGFEYCSDPDFQVLFNYTDMNNFNLPAWIEEPREEFQWEYPISGLKSKRGSSRIEEEMLAAQVSTLSLWKNRNDVRHYDIFFK